MCGSSISHNDTGHFVKREKDSCCAFYESRETDAKNGRTKREKERDKRTNHGVVYETESRRDGVFRGTFQACVMSRRPHAAKNVSTFPFHDAFDAFYGRPGGSRSGA